MTAGKLLINAYSIYNMDSEGLAKGIHLGIIPDGSRRWAKINGIDNYNGRQSGEAMEKVVTHVFEKYPEVNEMSIWVISTENLLRPTDQKKDVFQVLEWEFKKLNENRIIFDKDIKVNVIGSRFGEVPEDVKSIVMEVVNKSRNNKSRNLNVCIGYGGKQEIIDAVMAATRWLRKNPTIEKIHENVFENFLQIPRPLDIVIRTGGQKRLSGFMLYQIEYAELFFTDTLWPDFGIAELDRILKEFSQRERRFGK
jgi:undecaprenyl diphosphate synthase